ncbi:EscI/YscI/HrpB family type III secretion system inner rod protein [Erwinia psidii]|uniref:Type III secretion system protein n=1 Tax=Erwinia psidii TaxID=69224 RepID=A0A3N6SM19_9GAMM|nr:EscI/YscI/HrpB family type III secretion system inner rod protein [Erwinia psidii]MCX8956576.1 hypothetical protein [Erwinia psidii]MCX8961514.1 hypothetical protein [Erwinia psidii]MCX8965018.1 hypothetical protein [Erwinia psidii]RQM39911.1 hypothetical protein EB241_00940 [Erwinia psidii]
MLIQSINSSQQNISANSPVFSGADSVAKSCQPPSNKNIHKQGECNGNKPGKSGSESSQSNKTSSNSDSESIFNQIFSMLNKLSQQAGQSLKSASGSSDPYNVLKANRSMSDYYLNNQFFSKMIGKVTNSLEKLTSLQ